jgi:hypothetical protein
MRCTDGEQPEYGSQLQMRKGDAVTTRPLTRFTLFIPICQSAISELRRRTIEGCPTFNVCCLCMLCI